MSKRDFDRVSITSSSCLVYISSTPTFPSSLPYSLDFRNIRHKHLSVSTIKDMYNHDAITFVTINCSVCSYYFIVAKQPLILQCETLILLVISIT